MKTVAVFQSDLWKIESDLPEVSIGMGPSTWLISELRKRFSAEGPIAEDWGWLISINESASRFHIAIGARPKDSVDPAVWIVFVEKKIGFFRKLLGKADLDEKPVVYAIDTALKGVEHIHNLTWHSKEKFDKGDESDGSENPN